MAFYGVIMLNVAVLSVMAPFDLKSTQIFIKDSTTLILMTLSKTN